MDLKNNKGILNNKESVEWPLPHGTEVEFDFDGRVQLNGEAGIIAYLTANILVNPHMTLHYKTAGQQRLRVERARHNGLPGHTRCDCTAPAYDETGGVYRAPRLHGRVQVDSWLRKSFSRISENVINEISSEAKIPKPFFAKALSAISAKEFETLFSAIQNKTLMAPPTSSVMAIGEDLLSKSIKRIGEIDFFATISRKPTICDFKPVLVEVAIARLKDRGTGSEEESEDSVQVLRFANRVPLQFDKSCLRDRQRYYDHQLAQLRP